jgi:hypothetical protein
MCTAAFHGTAIAVMRHRPYQPPEGPFGQAIDHNSRRRPVLSCGHSASPNLDSLGCDPWRALVHHGAAGRHPGTGQGPQVAGDSLGCDPWHALVHHGAAGRHPGTGRGPLVASVECEE